MDEDVENITLEGLSVGSVAQNLESDIVSHNASLNGFTLSTKTSLETINQLEYDKDSEKFVFLESSDLVNSERSKNEINKNTGYVVIGKDTANNDIRVVLFSEDGYQTDEEIDTENLVNYKNRLQNYFQFDYFDNGEIDTSKFDGEIADIRTSINTINSIIGEYDENDGSLSPRIKNLERLLSSVDEDNPIEIPNVEELIRIHNTDTDAHNNKFDSLQSLLETSRVAVTDFNAYKDQNRINILEKIEESTSGELKFDYLEGYRGTVDKFNLNHIYFPDDYLPSKIKKISIFTHVQGIHSDVVNYLTSNNGGVDYYLHVFKTSAKSTSNSVNNTYWNGANWQHVGVSLNSSDMSLVNTDALFEFENEIVVEDGSAILLSFSASASTVPDVSWNNSSNVKMRLSVYNTAWPTGTTRKVEIISFISGVNKNTTYIPKVCFYEELLSSSNHTHEQYVEKDKIFVQEKVTCTELPTALKSGVVYDLGDCSYVYSASTYDFRGLAFDEIYDGKVAQCEIIMTIPSDRAGSQVYLPTGWVNETGATPITLTSSNTGKKLWFIAKYYGKTESTQNVVLKQFAILDI